MAPGSNKDYTFVVNTGPVGTFYVTEVTEPATNRNQRRTARKRGRKGRR